MDKLLASRWQRRCEKKPRHFYDGIAFSSTISPVGTEFWSCARHCARTVPFSKSLAFCGNIEGKEGSLWQHLYTVYYWFKLPLSWMVGLFPLYKWGNWESNSLKQTSGSPVHPKRTRNTSNDLDMVFSEKRGFLPSTTHLFYLPRFTFQISQVSTTQTLSLALISLMDLHLLCATHS